MKSVLKSGYLNTQCFGSSEAIATATSACCVADSDLSDKTALLHSKDRYREVASLELRRYK